MTDSFGRWPSVRVWRRPLDREGTQITSVCTPELITAKVLMTAPNGGSSRSVSGWAARAHQPQGVPAPPHMIVNWASGLALPTLATLVAACLNAADPGDP